MSRKPDTTAPAADHTLRVPTRWREGYVRLRIRVRNGRLRLPEEGTDEPQTG